ncbi:hypothetical protein [Lactococcus allomyrinae]|uniref:Uncharacterized protein n=1 Tax=Lactococcus allomyrinae TaxID=2419773 RepID=A0A387BBM4_9LACT|nr:hypothetical protein [Lactococcus allomyrinae]AYF99807.1 hypothetical protein D7I46_01130 [Lactococcus allomyrinae]
MITVFVGLNNKKSIGTAIQWLKAHHLSYKVKHIEEMTLSELIHILSLTDEGTSELEANPDHKARNKAWRQMHEAIENAESLREVQTFIHSYPQHFHGLFIVDEQRLVIGFNANEIRCFVPRENRHVFINGLHSNELREHLNVRGYTS